MRRTLPAMLAFTTIAALSALALPAGAPASAPALVSSPVTAVPAVPAAARLGRLPNPVQMHLGAPTGVRLARSVPAIPASYDLRPLGRLTTVRDQGNYGTCWAFANVAALESSLLSGATPETWNFSEDNLVSRSGFGPFSKYPGPWDLYDAGGYDAMAVAYFVRWAGPVDESADPYPSRIPPRVNIARKHVQDAIMLPGRSSYLGNDLLKQMVMQYGALSVGMYWGDGGYRNAKSSFYRATHTGYENHGVTIVGWDDSYSRHNFGSAPPGDGAFLVRNTWGASFGDGGYFWASYYNPDFAFGDCTAYARVDAPGVYQRRYQYDKLGLVGSMSFKGVAHPATASFANRFKARTDGHLAAVGFYATAGTASYTVLAGPSLSSLTACASGTLEYPGYHTIDLPGTMTVHGGSRFVVAVRLTTPGAKPIPVEQRVRYYSSLASASPGQSYVRPGTGRWYDLTRFPGKAEANVCLKAYTTK